MRERQRAWHARRARAPSRMRLGLRALLLLVPAAVGGAAFTPPEGLLNALETALSRRRDAALAALRPNRIILVRHGESEGNADRTAYAKTPDSQIALTERGFAQGAVAGLQIRQLVGDETVRFFVSPYLRARQTLLAILRAFDGTPVYVSSEPRLREQDFGNFQSPDEMDTVFAERQKFGRFYYRFPNGEAGTDVFDRMASFITYLFRTMGEKGYFEAPAPNAASAPAQNYVLVTHGLLMRIFCMCYLRWTVPEFEQVRAPPPHTPSPAWRLSRRAARAPSRRCGTLPTARSGCFSVCRTSRFTSCRGGGAPAPTAASSSRSNSARIRTSRCLST